MKQSNSSNNPTLKQHRFSNEDMENGIFHNKPPAKSITDLKDEIIVYTMSGLEDSRDVDGNPILLHGGTAYADQRPESYAKKVTSGGKVTYFIKLDDDSQYIDPNPNMKPSNAKNAKHIYVGKDRFKQVAERTFLMYVGYLRTRNKARLIQARREMI